MTSDQILSVGRHGGEVVGQLLPDGQGYAILLLCLQPLAQFPQQNAQVIVAGGQAPRVEDVVVVRLVDQPRQRAAEDQPEPAVPVGGDPEALVEASDCPQPAEPHGRPPADEAALQDRRALVLDRERVVGQERADPFTVDHESGIGRDEVEIGAGGGQVRESLQPSRVVGVVGVENRQEITRCRRRSCVARGRRPAVVLADKRHLIA